jgi:hypothetical protein
MFLRAVVSTALGANGSLVLRHRKRSNYFEDDFNYWLIKDKIAMYLCFGKVLKVATYVYGQ